MYYINNFLQSYQLMIYFLILILALSIRLIFTLFFPETGGDFDVYQLVANNIIRGCGVSMSSIDTPTHLCVAHFGGNQGPGYPFFLSAVWQLSNFSFHWVRILQALIISISIIRLCYSIDLFFKNKNFLIFTGIVLSLSPFTLAWSRYLQTESLSLAIIILIVSELLISIKLNKIKILNISLLFLVSTWIRLDNIFLIIPIAVAILVIEDLKNSFKKFAILGLIFLVPWGSWTIRNITSGVNNIIPTDMIMPGGSRSPSGYLAWVKTWITNEYERPLVLWNVNKKIYSTIEIPSYAYKNEKEKEKIEYLLKKISVLDGQSFPKDIDDSFLEIAELKRKIYLKDYWLINPLKRSVRLWLNPFSSLGWPSEMPDLGLSKQDRLNASLGNSEIILSKIKAYPYHAAAKLTVLLYKILIYLGIVFVLWKLIYTREKNINIFLQITISFFLIKTMFSAFNGNVETRYSVPVLIFFEVLVIYTILFSLKNKKKSLK